MTQRSPGALFTRLLCAAAVCILLLVALYLVFVRTAHGQLVDDASLRGTAIGRRHIIDPVHSILDVVSVTALGLATIAVGAVAFLRRRPILALLTMLLVVGSNVTTEALKHLVLTRPHFDPLDPLPFNTLPSGHTTVAVSVGVAFALVAPARLRVVVAVLGAVYGATTGVATMSAGWHRPSDAVAACLVVGAWVALVGALAVRLRHVGERPPDDLYVLARTTFVVLAGLLLAAGISALVVTAFGVHPGASRPRLFLAYAGGACSVAGAALAAMAALIVVARQTGIDELDGNPAGP